MRFTSLYLGTGCKFFNWHNALRKAVTQYILQYLHLIFDKFRVNALYLCTAELVSHETASSSAERSRDKPPFSFISGQDSTMWDIVWVSPQGHRSVSVSCHFFLQAPQCPCSMQKWFSTDHCCRGRSKPGCRIVGSHTR